MKILNCIQYCFSYIIEFFNCQIDKLICHLRYVTSINISNVITTMYNNVISTDKYNVISSEIKKSHPIKI